MQTNESPSNGMEAEAFRNRCLTLLVSRRILRLRYQDKHSLAHNLPYLAIAERSLSVNAVRSTSFCTTRDAGESGLLNSGRRIRSPTLMPKAWLRRAYENRCPVYNGLGFSTSSNHQRALRIKDND